MRPGTTPCRPIGRETAGPSICHLPGASGATGASSAILALPLTPRTDSARNCMRTDRGGDPDNAVLAHVRTNSTSVRAPVWHFPGASGWPLSPLRSRRAAARPIPKSAAWPIPTVICRRTGRSGDMAIATLECTDYPCVQCFEGGNDDAFLALSRVGGILMGGSSAWAGADVRL